MDEAEPERLWLAALPAAAGLDELVAIVGLRRHIERDYLELKQELGLGDYEGRGWRGFHHHASLCVAAYGFLVRERCLSPLRPGAAVLPATTDRPLQQIQRRRLNPAASCCCLVAEGEAN